MPPGQPPTTVVIVHDGVEVASWPLPEPGRHDLAVVDVLARVALAGRRLGFSVRLRDPSDGLLELLDLAGLASAPGCPFAVEVSTPSVVQEGGPSAAEGSGPSVVEVGGEPEGGEQPGVEERVDPGDAPA